jgi:Pyruvate/2-oxoacid:ferredoxin oxidoreductase delta subunit
MFSTIIITTAIDSIEVTPSYMKKRTLVSLKLFNLTMYIIGLVLFIGTAVVSLIYRNNNFILNRDTVIFFVTLIFPVVISGLLYYKSNKKIDFHVNVEDNINLNSNTKVIFKIKFAVQIFFLILFCILLFAGKIQVWLLLLIVGFCASLILGRVYCGWFCPVNTVNGLFEFLFKLLGIKKRRAPQFLQRSLSRIICLTVFLCFFTFSLIFGKRLQLFLIITYLGALVSAIFVSSFWCNYLCPWGTILKITSKFSAFKWMIKKDKCIKCGVCSLNCTSGSIRISDEIQSIEFTKCLQCMQCIRNCHKDAIKIQKQ